MAFCVAGKVVASGLLASLLRRACESSPGVSWGWYRAVLCCPALAGEAHGGAAAAACAAAAATTSASWLRRVMRCCGQLVFYAESRLLLRRG